MRFSPPPRWRCGASVRTPLHNPDFARYLQRIKDSKPDAVFVFLPPGSQTIAFVKGYEERGIKQARQADRRGRPDRRWRAAGDGRAGAGLHHQRSTSARSKRSPANSTTSRVRPVPDELYNVEFDRFPTSRTRANDAAARVERRSRGTKQAARSAPEFRGRPDDPRREQPQDTPEGLIKLFDIITIIRSTMSGRVPSWAGRPRAPSESPSDLYRV
jgi:hypothetical protein